MAHSISTISAVRFGYGFGRGYGDVSDLPDLVSQLDGHDDAVAQFPLLGMSEAARKLKQRRSLAKAERDGDQEARQTRAKLQKELGQSLVASQHSLLARASYSPNGFRERLVQFWTDHFTVTRKNLSLAAIIPSFIDDAVRPNISGNFGDLLTACTLHPAMLLYLDQVNSVGPNSKLGLRNDKGLNENLARELLELHTLGIDAKYSQTDVRQLAELLTGLRVKASGKTIFQGTMAEPGSEQVLGKSYGGKKPELSDIKEFLIDVSMRKDTAKHIARKLVIHFITDAPDSKQIDYVARRFFESKGDLRQTYIALLEHPGSQIEVGAKVKQPFDFIVSGIRALDVKRDEFIGVNHPTIKRMLTTPLHLMGQRFFSASGPDGWPESSEAWITPVGLAGRLQWAIQIAQAHNAKMDPRQFMNRALGELASKELGQAVVRAANKHEAIAMVLVSPEFNRR